MRLLYGYTMSDELEHSATLRARAACLREHRLHFILCFGAFLAGATGSLLTASFLKANVAAPNGTLLAEGLAMLGVIGLGGLLSALFRCLSSRHSRLGKSVLSQYPAESVDPKAVFQEIDADILQHGKRFGGLSIGKEWAIFKRPCSFPASGASSPTSSNRNANTAKRHTSFVWWTLTAPYWKRPFLPGAYWTKPAPACSKACPTPFPAALKP